MLTKLFLVLVFAALSSCALVTVPVKVLGKTAETAIGVTGAVVKAPFGGDDDKEEEE